MTVAIMGDNSLYVSYDSEDRVKLVSESFGIRREHELDEESILHLTGTLLSYLSRLKTLEKNCSNK